MPDKSTADYAAEIRADFKQHGFSSRQVTVKPDGKRQIHIIVKYPNIPIDTVLKILKPRENDNFFIHYTLNDF